MCRVMQINRTIKSQNFTSVPITVEFLVLHYTACSLNEAFEIFCAPENGVSTHLIISETGEVFELVQCWDDKVMQAWHAGRSHFNDGQRRWENFNDFSIGIELVNLNGNIFGYSPEQYQSLYEIISHFKGRYKVLENPARIIGHEQIAGWRGKIDPGWMFDWDSVYFASYSGCVHPERTPALPSNIRDREIAALDCLPSAKRESPRFWPDFNLNLETIVRSTTI